jgi:hypothetical protein
MQYEIHQRVERLREAHRRLNVVATARRAASVMVVTDHHHHHQQQQQQQQTIELHDMHGIGGKEDRDGEGGSGDGDGDGGNSGGNSGDDVLLDHPAAAGTDGLNCSQIVVDSPSQLPPLPPRPPLMKRVVSALRGPPVRPDRHVLFESSRDSALPQRFTFAIALAALASLFTFIFALYCVFTAAFYLERLEDIVLSQVQQTSIERGFDLAAGTPLSEQRFECIGRG